MRPQPRFVPRQLVALLMRLALCLLLMGAETAGVAYRLSLPPEVEVRSEEERTAWLNQHLDDAYTVQMRVARERYDKNMARADALVSQMAAQAVAIENESAAGPGTDNEHIAMQSADWALVILGGAMMGLLAWLIWRARGDLRGSVGDV